MDYDLTKKVLAALEAERVEYVVFGAVALALHGLVRREIWEESKFRAFHERRKLGV